MAEFVFTSPGVKFKERDLSFVTRNVGVTTLGVVGETLKGPAFEPVFVQDQGEFRDRFGLQSVKKFPSGKLKYELPYVANAYLEESSQLWVTRVLGVSGYDAGTAWGITLSAGVDLSTTGVTTTVPQAGVPFSGSSYLGNPIYNVGDTGSLFTGFTKTGPETFSGDLVEFTAVTYNSTTGDGTVDNVTTTITGSSHSEYEGMVLAVIRSRGYVMDNVNLPKTTEFDAEELMISANGTNMGIGDLFGEFTLTASKTSDPEDVPESYTATLDPNSSSFLSNVIGSEPKDKNTKLWVESIFPDLIEKLDADGLGYGINTQMIDATSNVFVDYNTQFKTPETPWVVSQIRGSEVERLFKFISISDGDSANQEIKISIANIKPDTYEFDVFVRDFNDTDASPIVLESFTRCTMIKEQTNFIGQRIGTSDGDYDLQSKYVMIEFPVDVDELPVEVFPAGFEGINQNNWAASATSATVEGIAPQIMYKTEYDENEKINKVYLGVSENAYNGVGLAGTGINQKLFNFNGWKNSGGNSQDSFVKSKGFHMDSSATGTYYDGSKLIGEFEVGAGHFQTINDVVDPTDTYYNSRTRKFTLVPTGGFDGWDVHRNGRSNGDGYQQNGIWDGVSPNQIPKNDFQAWETAIDTLSNPEEVTINLFATPGINWSDNNILVQETLDMIEEERTDSLYVIDAPDINFNIEIGEGKPDVLASTEIVNILDEADIDSSYAATYFPYIQIRDAQNNLNVYVPPTGEVVKSMAFTDNTKFPWFAPAGLNRGVTDARKSKYKLSLDARDILYSGRINPLADFADSGTAIFGQKTLQANESALDRINVRRLLLQVKVLISNIATRLVFEQNDQATIDQFLSKATPILDTIKRERGLQEFRIKMDDTNNTTETRDRNELYGEIFLKPTRAVEFIGITFTVTPSGASFDEASA